MRAVICGAGVIGAAIAYYLAERGVAATVVDRCGIAAAASGNSGGFLALDWCDGSPLEPLARASFELHQELARTLPEDCGYRRVDTLALAAGPGLQAKDSGNRPGWLDGACATQSIIGTQATTAQVHPEKLTRALIGAAQSNGAKLHIGCVEGVELTGGGTRVSGVRVDGAVMPADVVIIAMGPWSMLAASWLPLPPVTGLKGYSITLRPRQPVSAHALFVDYRGAKGEQLSPEVFPRPDGEVYICGMSDQDPVPEDPADVHVDERAIAVLRALSGSMSSVLAEARLTGGKACYRPITHDALPLLGPVSAIEGAYVATAHNCWGILNAPASGLAMAELIVDGGAGSIDLSPYSPGRFENATTRPRQAARP